MSECFLGLILSSLLFSLQISVAKEATTLPPAPQLLFKKMVPIVTLTPYEWFIDMPLERRAKYVQRLRQFLIEQDQKNQRYSFERPLSSPFIFELLQTLEQTAEAETSPAAVRNVFPADDGACYKGQTVPEDLPEGIQRLISDNQDRCVVGGNVVCMVINPSNRMTCKLSDMPDTRDKLRGSCGQGQIQCAYPLSVDKAKKGPLCLPEKVGLTMDCFGDKALSSTEVAAFVKDKNLKAEYDKMKSSIEKYCGPSAEQAKDVNYFDKPDCEQLHKWLSGIVTGGSESAQAGVTKKSFGCRFQLPGGQVAKVTVAQAANGKKTFKTEMPSGAWQAMPDSSGAEIALTTLNENAGYEQLSFEQLDSSCNTFYYRAVSGDLETNTRKCTLKIQRPSGNPIEFFFAGSSGEMSTPFAKLRTFEAPIVATYTSLLGAEQKKLLGSSELHVSTQMSLRNKDCSTTIAGAIRGTTFPVQDGPTGGGAPANPSTR